MICRWLTSLLIVASLANSLAEDAPSTCPSWSAEFNPVNNIQIGGPGGSCNSTAIEELLTLTRTILELLQNQEPCCTPLPTPGACASNPCQNGGTCTPTNEGLDYQCTCSAGYTGATCDSDIDECVSNPCQNGGTCINQINGYRCECLAGYTGANCALDTVNCASNPCQNGGTCSDKIIGYQCDCPTGYTGPNCATDIDECASNPCQNGGTCTDEVNGYSCECLPGFIGTHCVAPQDCADIMAAVTDVSGVYYIFPEGVDSPLQVYCDMETDGGGWTVFQRREDGSVGFFLEWDDYKNGFGEVSSEHWLGNDNIHHLSTQKTYELRVDLEDFEEETRFAVYSGFSIGDEAAKYVLALGNYSGNADVNECASNPCQNGGTCTDEVNGYSCECSPGFIGTNCIVPQDCADIMAAGTNFSGVFYIFPDGVDGPLRVYCDMDTDGGGWTVFQRRENGSVDFFLEWDDYKHGFGNVSSEHWLGNDNIHHLSTQNTYELRVDLEDFEGESRFAVYSGFSIGDEAAKYVLTVSGYSGNAGDSLMSYHSGHPFTTKDRDNDSHNAINCASRFTGAWWYVSCHKSNLNGLYLYGENDQVSKGVNWFHWHGFLYSLKKTEMKIRPL